MDDQQNQENNIEKKINENINEEKSEKTEESTEEPQNEEKNKEIDKFEQKNKIKENKEDNGELKKDIPNEEKQKEDKKSNLTETANNIEKEIENIENINIESKPIYNINHVNDLAEQNISSIQNSQRQENNINHNINQINDLNEKNTSLIQNSEPVKNNSNFNINQINDLPEQNTILSQNDSKLEKNINININQMNDLNEKNISSISNSEQKKNNSNFNINQINDVNEKNISSISNSELEKITIFQNTNYSNLYKKNHFCDYFFNSKWCPGFITNITNDNIAEIINVTNSSIPKSNIDIKNPSKISYFRKYTFADDSMANGTKKDLKRRLLQLTLLHKNDLFNNSELNSNAYNLYYFLRVTLYFSIDFCMIENLEVQEVEISFQIILSVLDLINDYFKFIESNINDFANYEKNIKNTELMDLVLINPKYASYSFFDDVFFLIRKIFGNSAIYLNWFIKYNNLISQFIPSIPKSDSKSSNPDLNKYLLYETNSKNNDKCVLKKTCDPDVYKKDHFYTTLNKKINSYIVAYFIDYFTYINGVNILFKFLYNESLSIKFKQKIIKSLEAFKPLTNSFELSNLQEIKNLKDYILNYFGKKEKDNLQKNKKDEITNFFDKILNLTEQDENSKLNMHDCIYTNMILNQLITSKKLEEKLKILNALNNILKSVEYNSLFQKIYENIDPNLSPEMLNDKKFADKDKKIKKMNMEYFCKICQKNKIIEYFINDQNAHVEIIKRLPQLLFALYSNDFGYSQKTTELKETKIKLFKGLFTKLSYSEKNDENLYNNIHDIILDFCNVLKDEDKYDVYTYVENFFIDILSNERNKCNKINNLFKFIIDYSTKCFDIKKFKFNFKEEEKQKYDLFYNYIFEEKEFFCIQTLLNFTKSETLTEFRFDKEQKINIINISIDGIMQIINSNNQINDNGFFYISKIILIKCINDICLPKNTEQNIILLEKIYNNMNNNPSSKKLLIEELQQASKSFGLISRIVDELSIILKNIQNNPENVDDNKDNILKRLEFIFLLINKENGIEINFDSFIQLFNDISSLNNSSLEIVKDSFYNLLSDNITKLNPEFVMKILNEILLKLAISDFHFSNYSLFKKILIEMNINQNKFIFINDKKSFFVFSKENCNDIIGYQKLLDILINTTNKEIQNDISDLLANIYFNIRFNNLDDYGVFWRKMIDFITKSFNEAINNKNMNVVGAFINLIKKIVEKNNDKGEIINNVNDLDSELKKLLSLYSNNNDNNKINNDKNKNGNKNNIKKSDKIEQNIQFQKLSKKKVTFIYLDNNYDIIVYEKEYFYFIRYILSYKSKIPVNTIQVEFNLNINNSKNANNKTAPQPDVTQYIFNLFQDYNDFYSKLTEIEKMMNSKQKDKNKKLTFILKQIPNIIETQNINPKSLLFNNKDLSIHLRNLLKEKNEYVLDIMSLMNEDLSKQNDELKKAISNLINNPNEPNTDNNLKTYFNFNESNIYYINYILSYLIEVLKESTDKKTIINNFLNSKIWTKELENKKKDINISENDYTIDYIINIESNKNSISKEELFEKNNCIFNMLLIYSMILENNDNNIEIMEKIANKFISYFIFLINECIYLNLENLFKDNTKKLKKIYLNLITQINDIIIKNKHFSLVLLNLLTSKDNKKFEFVFIKGIIENKLPFISKKISETLLAFTEILTQEKEKDNNLLIKILSIYFTKDNLYIIVNLLNNIENNNSNKNYLCEYGIKLYFDSVALLLNKIYCNTYNTFNYDKYFNEIIIPKIFDPIIGIKNIFFNDLILGGFCKILYTYISSNSNLSSNLNLNFQFKSKNIKDYLFEEIIMFNCDNNSIISSNHSNNIKNDLFRQLSTYSLAQISHLFIAILMNEKEKNKNINYYIDKLNSFHALGYWKDNKISDWKLSFKKDEKISPFIGLKNLGCTCYINSLLQTFFNIQKFRESILKCPCNDSRDNVLFELQKVFFSLKHLKANYYVPTSFPKNFGGEKLDVHQQMDADEFFSRILDKIEIKLKNTKNENLVKYFFQGKFNDSLKFKEGCTHHRANINTFYSVQLQVQNRKNIYESLDTLIEGELMDGDNCIHCPQCNKKFPAIKAQSFKILPRMLMFVLKRFEFNYDTMQKIKINDYYEFPLELDMNKYTDDFINNKNEENENKNNLYKLKGVVVHMGSSEGGHYYSFVKDSNSEKWYKFNDTQVTEFDVKELENETFGGQEKEIEFDGKEKIINKNRNAYLLFYEKIDEANCENFDNVDVINKCNKEDDDFNLLNDNEENINNINTIHDNNCLNEITDIINKDMSIYYLKKKLFSSEYHHFILELYLNLYISLYPKNKQLKQQFECLCYNNNEFQLETEAVSFRSNKPKGSNISKYINENKIIIFNSNKAEYISNEIEQKIIISIFEKILITFFNVVIRCKERKYLGCFVDLIKFFMNKYIFCSEFLIEEFSNYNVLMEYLLNCPLYETKKIIVGLIYCAMINIKFNFKIIDDEKENNQKNNKSNSTNNKLSNQNSESLNGFEVIDKEDSDEALARKMQEEENIKINDNENKSNIKIDKEKYLNSIKNVPVILLKLIHNIFFLINKIGLKRHTEHRFFLAVIFRFSTLDENCRNLLVKKIKIFAFLNLYLFPKLRVECRDSLIVNTMDIGYFKPSHEILNSQLNSEIKGEFDKIGKYQNENYALLLLLNILNCPLIDHSKRKLSKGFFEDESQVQKLNKDYYHFGNREYFVQMIIILRTIADVYWVSNLINRKCIEDKNNVDRFIGYILYIIEEIYDNRDNYLDLYDKDNNKDIEKNQNIKENERSNFLKLTKYYLCIIYRRLILDKNNKNKEYQIELGLKKIFEFFKKNKKIYSLSIFAINLIIDIFSYDYKFMNKYKEEYENEINSMKKWLKEYKIPPKYYMIKGIHMYNNDKVYYNENLDKKFIEEFKAKEIRKTDYKIELLDKILNREKIFSIENIYCDLTDFKFTIGDKVSIKDKNYLIVGCIDEMIKVRLIDANDDEFKVKGCNEKKKVLNDKDKICFWVETDNSEIRIKELKESELNIY